MTVNADALSLVLIPLTIVDIAVSMDQPTAPVGFVVHPPSLIHRAVGPNLFAFAFTSLSADNPLSFVFRLVFKGRRFTIFESFVQDFWLSGIVVKITQLVADILQKLELVTYGDASILIIDYWRCACLLIAEPIRAHASMHLIVSQKLLVVHSGEETAHPRLNLNEQNNLSRCQLLVLAGANSLVSSHRHICFFVY